MRHFHGFQRARPRLMLVMVLLLMGAPAGAASTYQTPEAFLAETFAGAVPPAERLWIRGGLKTAVAAILDHDLGQLRVRYWRSGDRTAWILDEIGKERPITTGLVVDRGKIESVRVLIYRESRGSEVQYPFFTTQFHGAVLTPEMQLDRSIDAISGATLSVRALTKLARLALLFDQHAQPRDTAVLPAPERTP